MNTQLQWNENNQSYLANTIDRLIEILESHPSEHTQSQLLSLADQPYGKRLSSLDVLAQTFGLTTFEKLLLLLCAGVELDARLAAACNRLSNQGLNFSLALSILPEPHWSALSPASPLRNWRMIELTTGRSLVNTSLRIDERILHFLTGVSYLDDRLQSYVNLIPSQLGLKDSYTHVINRLCRIYQNAADQFQNLRVELRGEDGNNQLALIATAMVDLDVKVYRLRSGDIPTSVVERDSFIRLWEREAILSPVVLVLDLQEQISGDHDGGVRHMTDRLRSPVFVSATRSLRRMHTAHLSLEIPRLSPDDQLKLWEQQLNNKRLTIKSELAGIVSQFDLTYSQIQHCANEFNSCAQAADAETALLLWNICREHVRAGFQSLAQAIVPCATWDDLILSDNLTEMLRDIAIHVRHRYLVHESWGFSRLSQRGLGISALFSGPSGTGKTMAAEVLANELQLDLYRIDLSQVVSKYIGETEKNLRRLFDCAESSGAILLFDEADALFGKRSEVRDSHDRHANIEVSYLLQRMEAYRGLAILTTNKKEDLDPAFLRRIRFFLHFSFPNAEQRKGIWQRIFPDQTPINELDVQRLANLNIAGGNIRNIAINAAFYGASEQRAVDMGHLLRAARREYAKLEKPLSDAEFNKVR